MGNTGHIPPPPSPHSYFPALGTYLLSRNAKISDNLAIISMISDEKPSFLCLGINASHCNMPKVGVVTCLRMRIVHNLVKFPPPLIALYPSLLMYQKIPLNLFGD